MPIRRRNFMKLLGVSVASLFLSRCRLQMAEPTPTCYAPIAPTETHLPTTAPSTREHLRLYWLRFGELAENSRKDTENKFGQELITGHRAILDELVASQEVSAPVADLVHEAYTAAVYHVWRSNAPITCYKPVMVNYAPTSAAILLEQSQVLNQIAESGTVDPTTLTKAQSALEHDMAFYALSDEEVQALYNQLIRDNQGTGQTIPSFETLSLELTPEAKEATEFIIDLLTRK